jgi:phage-related holin
MTKADISMFNELVQSFIVEQITRQGLTVPEFTEEGLQSFREQIEEEKKKEKTDETVQ